MKVELSQMITIIADIGNSQYQNWFMEKSPLSEYKTSSFGRVTPIVVVKNGLFGVELEYSLLYHTGDRKNYICAL